MANINPLLPGGKKPEGVEITFRFPIQQIGEKAILIAFSDNGHPVINPDFADEQLLSGAEIRKATAAAVRAIAIIE